MELETSVYQCSECLNKNEDNRIPCTVVMHTGDIPDHCLFGRGGNVEWMVLQS
jgi:hypothetical protein